MIIREREIGKGVKERKYELSPMTPEGRGCFKAAMWMTLGLFGMVCAYNIFWMEGVGAKFGGLFVAWFTYFIIELTAGKKPEAPRTPANDK
jgi:hypothetical protein